ncbi:MAG: hypothetical protein WA902_04360 [Thermosynechococcaceae cyanobacterium]
MSERLDRIEALAEQNTRNIASDRENIAALRDTMFEGFQALQATLEQNAAVMQKQIDLLVQEGIKTRQIVQSLARSVQTHYDDSDRHN